MKTVPVGVAYDRLGLVATTIYEASGSAEGMPGRIFQIRSGDALNHLALLTSLGIAQIDGAGHLVRMRAFTPLPGLLFPALTLRTSQTPIYVGLIDNPDRLAFFDATGRLVRQVPCVLCRDPVAVPLDGDGDDGLLVRSAGGTDATLLSSRGDVFRKVKAKDFLTDIGGAQLPNGDGAVLLLYEYPDTHGGGTMRVMRQDGTMVSAWSVKPAAYFDVGIASSGEPSVLSVQGDEIVERRVLDGEVLSRTQLPGAEPFRSVHAAWWKDRRRIFVLSGGGYLPYHMVAVVDSAGARLYQETARKRSFALYLESTDSSRFFVAVEGRLVRYGLKD